MLRRPLNRPLSASLTSARNIIGQADMGRVQGDRDLIVQRLVDRFSGIIGDVEVFKDAGQIRQRLGQQARRFDDIRMHIGHASGLLSDALRFGIACPRYSSARLTSGHGFGQTTG